MARAKRTDRAEARRRHRAAQGLTDAELDAAEASDEAEARGIGPRDRSSARTTPTKQAPPPQRIGIGNAFRLAFRPLDLRGDLVVFPSLALRSKALWLPILLTVGSTALVGTVGIRTADLAGVVANFLFQYFVFTPAIGGVFIAGFLAPRASWLFGIVVGLVAALCFAIVVTVFPSQLYDTPPSRQDLDASISGAFFLSPLMGALFASMAAWYRRFLALSSPNRGRRAAAHDDRPNGRSRGSGSRR